MASGRKAPQNGEQVRILREIWNEMKSLNGRIDGLRGDVQDLRGDVQRLDGRIDYGALRQPAG